MNYVIVTAEADGSEGRSTPMMQQDALRWACSLIRDGITVVRIESIDGEDLLTEAEILNQCRSRRTRQRILRNQVETH